MPRLSNEQIFLKKLFQENYEYSVEDFNINPFDWDWIIKFITLNNLIPLFYHLLIKNNIEIPEKIKYQLNEQTLNLTAQNILLEQELKNLLKIFTSKKVNVIYLKGFLIQQLAYPPGIVRPMHDIDLLVDQKDLNKIEKILIKSGYIFFEGRISKEKCLINGEHDFPYIHKKKRILLEIHWHILDSHHPFNIEEKDLLSDYQQYSINDITLSSLKLEKLLIYQCLHCSFQHVYQNSAFKEMYEISQIIKKFYNVIDWNEFIKICEKWGCIDFVNHTLILSNNFFKLSIPKKIIERLKLNNNWPFSFGLKYIGVYNILSIKENNTQNSLKYLFLEMIWAKTITGRIKIFTRAMKKSHFIFKKSIQNLFY